MSKDRDDKDEISRRAHDLDAVSRYLAAAQDSDDAPPEVVAHERESAAPDGDTVAVFARCDTALALTPRLADSPALAWAFAEANRLARSEPPAAALPWYRRTAVAWSAAALSSAAALVLALLQLMPAGDSDPGSSSAAAYVAANGFVPIMVSPELLSRIAEIEPVVLLAESVAVDSRSLAVLPFVGAPSLDNKKMSAFNATPEDIYDRLIWQLRTIPGLYVIDPRTASVYANAELRPEEIALFLGVRAIVQGRVDSDGETISLDLQLTDAAGSVHSFERGFERPIAEIAALQNDAALSVVDALIEPETTDSTLN